MRMRSGIDEPFFRGSFPKCNISKVDSSVEKTAERGNPGSSKRISRCDSSFFRILNIVFVGLCFLAVEVKSCHGAATVAAMAAVAANGPTAQKVTTQSRGFAAQRCAPSPPFQTTLFAKNGEPHGEAAEWTSGKGRRLAYQNSPKATPGGGRPNMIEENESLFDPAVLAHNNRSDNSCQDMYGLSQLLCKYNECFIRNGRREGRSVDFGNEEVSLEEARDEIQPRRNRFIKKGYFEYMHRPQEMSETEFIEKISNLGDYVDPQEMSSIFYYVHTNERKKYFVMQENVITHWENLCHNYNVKEDFKKEQMRSLYEETTNFFLFKEKHFLKSFSKFVRFGRYNTKKFTEGLISYKHLWKEYRRMVNNFCSAKLDEVLKAYWEENRDEAFQMRIQY
ncbi:phist protein (Pf-fam-b) [Plasmodium vivax North Korean]|uniref:Phist protein (Pf-fam-b) n=1 Tax=Plasmodium vivax North Korean TaxID=1035514 RepID=A0A0J9TZB2_PLAVI|nr:phist protein (Pf-fam-b) [Plasmodium vivax North Korean]